MKNSADDAQIPLVSIIIVTYKTQAMTARCIESLDRFLSPKHRYEIVLVDNDSRDGTQEWAAQYAQSRPWLTYLPQPENLGFARANNIGISHSNAQIILLLNSDTYITDDSLIHAIDFLRASDDSVFGCGCTLLNPDGTPGYSYGKLPSMTTVLQELMRLKFGSLRAIIPSLGEPRHQIDFPCGAFFALKRKLISTVGGPLDEQFFMYCEETDLAARAMKQGLSIWYIPESAVVHLGGGSYPSTVSMQRMTHYYQSWHRYMIKHANSASSILLKYTLTLYYICKTVSLLVKNKSADDPLTHLRAIGEAWKTSRP